MHNSNEFDLIGQIERDLGPGRRSGRWTMFRCPFHSPDRHPSFAVTNGNGQMGPGWRCFSAACGKHGGPVGWFIEYHQMSKQEAISAVNGEIQPSSKARAPILSDLGMDYPPGELWQGRAHQLIEWAQDNLWGYAGTSLEIDWPELQQDTGEISTRRLPALDWLLSRGLTEQTLLTWRIGFIPLNFKGKDRKDDAYKWGLRGEKVTIFHGILIPCIIGSDTWYLKIRRPMIKPDKYGQVRGGKAALYMAQTLELMETVIFCEGELDALLLWQEVEDLVGVVTLGSATAEFSVPTWGLYLIHTRQRLIAYHLDEAGQKGADKLEWLHPQRLEIPQLTPGDKDLTDFYRSGGDLRALVSSAMASSPQEGQRAALLESQVI